MKKNNNIYLAVEDNKEGKIIDFEKIKDIKRKTNKKVKEIISKVDEVKINEEEWIQIPIRELREVLCEECFFNLMRLFD